VYPLSIDPFTLRALASHPAAVEVHAARGADFELLGRASLPLHALLGGANRVKLSAVPLRAANGRVIGSLQCELRIAVGLGTAWQAFCRDRPAEASTLIALIRRREEGEGSASAATLWTVGGDAAGAATAAAALSAAADTAVPFGVGARPTPNDLLVTVVAAAGLRSRELQPGGRLYTSAAPPSAYVQYTLPLPGARTGVSCSDALQWEVEIGCFCGPGRSCVRRLGGWFASALLFVCMTGAEPTQRLARDLVSGHRVSTLTCYSPLPRTLPLHAAFTPVVPHAYDPVFADTRAIPVVPTTAALAALAANPLHLLVCDDNVSLEPGHSLAAPPPPAASYSSSATAAAALAASTAGGPGGFASPYAQQSMLASAAQREQAAVERRHAPRAVLGVATVSLAGVAEGVDQEGTWDVVDERGQRVGTLTLR
jgi:hypothetical protein